MAGQATAAAVTYSPEAFKALSEENAKLRASIEQRNKLRVQVSSVDKMTGISKGAISVYGLNVKFPVTLYAGQWERLAAFMPEVLACIRDNADKISRK